MQSCLTMTAWMVAFDRMWPCFGASGRCAALSALVWAAAVLHAGPAIAQVNCGSLTAARCTQATGQYQILQSFQSLPNPSTGANVFKNGGR